MEDYEQADITLPVQRGLEDRKVITTLEGLQFRQPEPFNVNNDEIELQRENDENNDKIELQFESDRNSN